MGLGEDDGPGGNRARSAEDTGAAVCTERARCSVEGSAARRRRSAEGARRREAVAVGAGMVDGAGWVREEGRDVGLGDEMMRVEVKGKTKGKV